MDSVTAECETAIHDDASLWRKPTPATTRRPDGRDQSDEDASPADELLRRICRKDCSRHGRCIQGTCECMPGYTGAECSERTHQVPKVGFI